jgi:hypothetical protein
MIAKHRPQYDPGEIIWKFKQDVWRIRKQLKLHFAEKGGTAAQNQRPVSILLEPKRGSQPEEVEQL